MMIEDLGSSNGTFINGERVEKAELKPGDELRLDMVRFLVQSPGMETPSATPKPASESTAPPEQPTKPSSAKWAIILVLLIAAAVLGLKLSGNL